MENVLKNSTPILDAEAISKCGDIPLPDVDDEEAQKRLEEIWNVLHTSQKKAAVLYSVKSTLAQVAKVIGIQPTSIYVWDNLHLVKEASGILLKDVSNNIAQQMAKVAPKAVQRLEELMFSSDDEVSLNALKLFFKHIYRDTKMNSENNVTLNIQYVDKKKKEIDADYEIESV